MTENCEILLMSSHVDVPGNERPDRAARAMSFSEGYVPPGSIPCRDIYPYIRSVLNKRWQEAWANIGLNNLRLIKDTVSPWGTSYRANRREEVVLARLRIGHSRLTHGHLMGGCQQP